MKKILFVNACMRDASRTKLLADYLLSKLSGEITEVKLDRTSAEPLYADTLTLRSERSERGDFDHPIFDNAKQFREADVVVIAAPYWDLSSPAVLKAYLESLCNVGITFNYSPEGIPVSLCKAEKMYFITTAGGRIFSDEFAYGYIKMLFEGFFGIHDFGYIKAENLDIIGADVEAILDHAKEDIDSLFEVKA